MPDGRSRDLSPVAARARSSARARGRPQARGVRCDRIGCRPSGRSDLSRQHGAFRNKATIRAPALLAQLVEHLHGKEGVDGSSPSEGSAKAPETGLSPSDRLAVYRTCGGCGARCGAVSLETPLSGTVETSADRGRRRARPLPGAALSGAALRAPQKTTGVPRRPSRSPAVPRRSGSGRTRRPTCPPADQGESRFTARAPA
jgi:hypothetical protein